MMRYRVVIYPKAAKKLRGHVNFLARASIPAARKLQRAFQQVIQELRENPFLFSAYEENSHFRRALFCKRYQIYFEVIERTVYVYNVVDCRMDPEKLKRELE